MSNFFHDIWNLDILFLSRGKNVTETTVYMKKKKELVYTPPNIVRCYQIACKITTKRFIGWENNGELLTWNLQTTF